MKFDMKPKKPKIDILENVLDAIADKMGWKISIFGNMISLMGTEKSTTPSTFASVFNNKTDALGVLRGNLEELELRIRGLESKSGVCTKCGRPTMKK